MSDRTANIISIDYVRLYLHVKISRIDTKRMGIVYTLPNQQKGKNRMKKKKTKLITRKRRKDKNTMI